MRDWREDPLVMIEKRLYAVAPQLMRTLALGLPPEPALDAAAAACTALREAQDRHMTPVGIVIPPAARERLAALARRIDALAHAVAEAGPGDRAALTDALGAELPEAVESVMDALRAVFVQTMIERQVGAARRAEVAAGEIAQVSRAIYFASVNAAVESARVGEAGAGFAVIGQQIRVLAQQAAAALRRLREADEGEVAAADGDGDALPVVPAGRDAA